MAEIATKTKATKTVKKASSKTRYIEAVGRRKTATARVRITPSTKNQYVINTKELEAYFPTTELQTILRDAFETSKISAKFSVSAMVSGGGIHAQAEAVRHGISRALVSYDAELRGALKKEGFLKRDPRMKERKKPGLKKARKAAQWSKR